MFFPIQGNPYFNNVALLAPMNGVHNSTVFDDFSINKKTITRSGDVEISTALGIPAAFIIPGGSEWLTVDTHADFAIGTGPFTFQYYSYLLSLAGNYIFFDFRPPSTNGAYPMIYAGADGKIYYYFNNAEQITSAAGVVVTLSWQHMAICRDNGGISRLFVQGQQVGSSYSNSSSIPQNRIILCGNGFTGTTQYNGYIRDIELTRDVLYTANFTPPPLQSLLAYGPNKQFCQTPYDQSSFRDIASRGL